ncbi:MAG TPA: hypothetical protein VNA57_08420 [Acidimicrobiales bacterium]|nr:hypothetical protein [Acidimicrobiales bacterium]
MIMKTGAGVLVAMRWQEPASSGSSEIFQVLRLRDGSIVDIQDHEDRKRAVTALHEAA